MMDGWEQSERTVQVARELVRALDELELVANELAVLARLVADGNDVDADRARSAIPPLREARRHAEATLRALQELADALVDEMATRARWIDPAPMPLPARRG